MDRARRLPPQGTPHLHAQDQQTGWWFIVDNDGNIVDPFDLSAPDAIRYPTGQRSSPPATPSSCYEASFGWVHVKPGCTCPR